QQQSADQQHARAHYQDYAVECRSQHGRGRGFPDGSLSYRAGGSLLLLGCRQNRPRAEEPGQLPARVPVLVCPRPANLLIGRSTAMHRPASRPEPSCSHVLIDEDRISIRVHSDETGWPRCALVRLLMQLHPLCLQLALQIADVGERGELLSVAVPAGVKGENVLLKHPLKKPDHVIAVLQDQPVLRGISAEDLEAELFVEPPRSLDILDSQADRKRAKFHAFLLSV